MDMYQRAGYRIMSMPASKITYQVNRIDTSVSSLIISYDVLLSQASSLKSPFTSLLQETKRNWRH